MTDVLSFTVNIKRGFDGQGRRFTNINILHHGKWYGTRLNYHSHLSPKDHVRQLKERLARYAHGGSV